MSMFAFVQKTASIYDLLENVKRGAHMTSPMQPLLLRGREYTEDRASSANAYIYMGGAKPKYTSTHCSIVAEEIYRAGKATFKNKIFSCSSSPEETNTGSAALPFRSAEKMCLRAL